MTTPEESTQDGQENFADALLRQMNDEYLVPELERRSAEGDGVGEVFGFMVLFGSPADQIFFNGEVPGSFLVKTGRDVKAGEELGSEDFKELTGFIPNEEMKHAQFIVGLRCKTGWGLKLKFGKTNSAAAEHLARGVEFLETANHALKEGRIGPFADNAFSAAELFAKAELLSYSITADHITGSKKHGRVSATHGLWTRLDNSDRQFTQVLNELAASRGSARYVDGPISISLDRAKEIRHILDKMEADTRELVLGDPDSDQRTVWLYATRPLKAGQVLRQGDVSITPPRPKKPTN
ncbi:MAG: hypothetical protein HZB14_04195 [Actinobacteria bacterium]|nr:hypothetical protein [Actinomycetota bacterium]